MKIAQNSKIAQKLHTEEAQKKFESLYFEAAELAEGDYSLAKELARIGDKNRRWTLSVYLYFYRFRNKKYKRLREISDLLSAYITKKSRAFDRFAE
ncbi:MAG: hypothetical protein LBU73_06795 [Helicobacteraceae bacterium]|jgi:hypothetical protein|nr:hypothetical protein [Helicobacteraceae bacterium]